MKHIKIENIISVIEKSLDYTKRIELSLNKLGLDESHSIFKRINNAKKLAEEIKSKFKHANNDFHQAMKEITEIYFDFSIEVRFISGKDSELYKKLKTINKYLLFLRGTDLHHSDRIIKVTSYLIDIGHILSYYARGNKQIYNIYMKYANRMKKEVAGKIDIVIRKLLEIEGLIKKFISEINKIFEELNSIIKIPRYQEIKKIILTNEEELKKDMLYLHSLYDEVKFLIASINRIEQALTHIY